MRLDDLNLRLADIGVQASPWSFATFVVMQMLFFVVGAFFSFSMHPADPKLERLLEGKIELRKQMDGLWRKRAALAARHDRLLGVTHSALTKLREECLAKMAEYRDFNMRARKPDCKAPAWLRSGLDQALFAPVDLGQPLDCAPLSLDQLLKTAEERVYVSQ